MKYFIYLLLVLCGLTGCKKKLTQFYVDYDSQVIIQSSFGQILPFNVSTPDITTNSEAEFSSNDTRKDRIKSIFLKELTLSITSPQGEDFSFLNELNIYLSSDSQQETKIAFKRNIPSTIGSVISCDLMDVDLQEFIKDKHFKLRVEAVTDEAIAQDVHINVYSNYLVDAKLKK